MDSIFKAAGFAIAGVILAAAVKRNSADSGLLLTVAVCVGLLTMAVTVTGPILGFADDLAELTGLSSSVTAPLFKTVGIGIVSQTAASVCEDAKESAVAKAVELCGAVLALYTAIPLMSAVIGLIKELI